MVIEIDDIIYSVCVADGGESNTYGFIQPDTQKIYLNNSRTKRQMERTLAHEILHAIVGQARLRGDESIIVGGDDEKLVQRMEKIFWRFLRDNGFDFDKYIGENK